MLRMLQAAQRESGSDGLLGGCSDSCGWLAALIALLSYGTYGVPIKHTVHHMSSGDVNPLVFQSYKTVTMLCLAPLVVFLDVPLRWTPWGLLSGLLWVLGGTGGVVGVRWAGMSTAIATWASVMIMVNFVWGILVFQEPVANLPHTVAAFLLLGLGLIGMSRFGAPSTDSSNTIHNYQHVALTMEENGEESNDSGIRMSFSMMGEEDDDDDEAEIEGLEVVATKNDLPEISARLRRSDTLSASESVGEMNAESDVESVVAPPSFNAETHVRVFKSRVVSKRLVGIGAAVFNGLMAGSSLIPMHYAKRHGFGGVHYMLSYAVGAFISNLILWLIYYVVVFSRLSSLEVSWRSRLLQAAAEMPKPHLQQLWKPGLCAGLLLTVAMFGSILSVTYLGQGIGNSVIQAKIMVSGMWGIFFYKEVTDPKAIRNWFLSASVSVGAIIWLSRERIAATAATDDSHHRALLDSLSSDPSLLGF